MKRVIAVALGLGALSSGWAQDLGRVLSSTPVVQQVAVPRHVCSNQQMIYQSPNSGAGALIGAIAGGALGNAAGGSGAGRAAATAIGMVGGAVLGDRLEGQPPERVETVPRCGVQNVFENRTVGYNVVYEFGGRQYSVQTPNDPGPTIAVQVSPLGVGGASYAPAISYAEPVAPTYVVPAPVVRRYYRPYHYPPVALPFGYYGHGHFREYEHRHW